MPLSLPRDMGLLSERRSSIPETLITGRRYYAALSFFFLKELTRYFHVLSRRSRGVTDLLVT